MKLIENWRQWPRMWSQRAFMAIATIQGSVLAFMSAEQLAAPLMFFPSVTYGAALQSLIAALAVAGGVMRLLSQELPKE